MIARRAWTLAAGALGILSLMGAAWAQTVPPAATAPFDFYVMTLSWSPGFCDTGGAAKAPEQCAIGAGQGFVVHGLWPDNSRGPDPEDCDPNRDASLDDLQGARGLYPALGLARYEYRKHGTCAGLGAADYFTTVRYVREQLSVPDTLRAPRQQLRLSPDAIAGAFIDVNANLTRDDMAVTCGHGELEDVRFCISKDLKDFVICPKVSGHTCHAQSIAVAPLR